MDEVGPDSGGARPRPLRHGSHLSRFYRRLARRKAKQEAVVATARKMLKVVYWMLRDRGALPLRVWGGRL